MPEKDEQEFFALIQQAREEIKSDPIFQSDDWKWVYELEDEGFFIFCYLIEDFNQKILSIQEMENTVYTLLMMRHKLISPHLSKVQELPLRWQMQLVFNLYERLKKEEMNWEACESFVAEQMKKLPISQDN